MSQFSANYVVVWTKRSTNTVFCDSLLLSS